MDFTKLCSQLQKRASYKGEAEQTKRSGQKLTWKTKVDNEVVVVGGGRGGDLRPILRFVLKLTFSYFKNRHKLFCNCSLTASSTPTRERL